MAKQIQLRRGTTAQNNTFVGAEGELSYDTQKKELRVHDGSTVGGKVVDNTTRDVTSQVSNATETLAGKAKIATTSIAQAGVNDTDFLTAKKLRDALNATGSASAYACRAWVNFNGTTGAIRASGNVSSVTSEGNGTYLITFTQGMSDANYVVNSVGSARGDSTALAPVDGSFTTSSFRVRANYGGDNTAGPYSPSICCVTVFR